MTLEQLKALMLTDPNHPLAIKFREGQGVEHGLGNEVTQDNRFIDTINRRPMTPFDTGTVSGAVGGMGGLGGGTTQPMNLGQTTGNPRMFPPPSMPPPTIPQVPQVPTGLPNMNVRGGVGNTLIPPGVPRQQQVQPQVRPDDSRLGTPTQGRAFPAFNRTPLPPQPTNTQLPNPMLGTSRNVPGMDYRPPPPPTPQEKNIFGMPQGGDQGRFGMTGFFNRMFNDPARMAMLSGGLTALDPNAYYDKEGFGSPWTGLRAGLGGAQAGYKSVIDRRKAEAERQKLLRGGAYSTVETGPDTQQMQKDGELVGKPWKKRKKYALGSTESEIFAVDLFNPNDNIKIKEKFKNLTPLQQKEASREKQMALLKLDEVTEFEKIIKRNYLAGSEIPGTAMDVWNAITENFFDSTNFQDRADIKSAIERLTPMLTKEYIEESRVSDYERQLVRKALGYAGASSARDKIRAIPAIKKMLRMKAGMIREGDTTGAGTDKKAAFKKANPEMFDEQGNLKF